MVLFPQIILSALRENKAHLAVALFPATSTIRRQQESSQARALSRGCRGASSRGKNTVIWLCLHASQIPAWINKHRKAGPISLSPKASNENSSDTFYDHSLPFLTCIISHILLNIVILFLMGTDEELELNLLVIDREHCQMSRLFLVKLLQLGSHNQMI